MKAGLISSLICLFLGLSFSTVQSFELQTSMYKLENPKLGYYKLLMEVYLTEAETKDSFIIFQSKYLTTNILKAKAVDDLRNEIKTEIIVTEEGYFNVLVKPFLEKAQSIKVEIDIVNPNSFQVKGKRFSFNEEIIGEQLITVILPQGYGLLESTGMAQLGDDGRVHVEQYLAPQEKFPFHLIAAKLE